MMCEDLQALLLEAEPEELTATMPSPIASHLSSCIGCRHMALRLLSAQEPVRAAYLGVTPRVTAVEMAARAMRLPVEKDRRPPVPRWAWLPIGVAAAVALAVSLYLRPSAPIEVVQGAAASPDSSSPVISVDVPPGRNAVVFATRDPQVSVLWIY